MWAVQQNRDAAGEGSVVFNMESLQAFRHNLRRAILVNCWHENEGESAAMWGVYGDGGIAIKTTVGAMIEGFQFSDDEIVIGRVKYIDYTRDPMPSGVYPPFLHKRKSFEHEREVRAIILSDFDLIDSPYVTGKYQGVDLDALVQEIIVAPFQPDWFAELVASVSNKYGLKNKVQRSKLDISPDILYEQVWSNPCD